ncbi:Sec63-domain-containing protein [Amylocystis lapponica]|nr:Sec63-domain-containing protein [Amylocystis lapponica]
MPGIADHLSLLTGTKEDAGDRDRRALEEWTSYSTTGKECLDIDAQPLAEDLELEDSWDSVLAVYRHSSDRPNGQSDSLLSKLLSTQNVEPLLQNVLATLSSGRPDDAIAEELAETIGFDNIELVMDILANRDVAVQEVSEYIRQTQANGPPKSVGVDQDRQRRTTAVVDPENARKRMEETLRSNAARPLYTGTAQAAPEILPHVYTSSAIAQGNILSQFGSKYMLPLGTTRLDREDYEEVIIPPAKAVPPRLTERLIPVSELDPLAQGSFPGYTSLNRIQSIVFATAYQSNENMLVCDVAMLSILRVLQQHRSTASYTAPIAATIIRDAFKIIYVAPMKALASEIVRKLGKRLQWLSIRVRELTGDMQLTKSEIAETQIIVTTPEKWDVVTRKPTGEGELASTVKLLIIDEVHLLNDERGAVIETIVARTLRQVESSQSVIRIVGLSATLPNYIDVADFLSVPRRTGLFYFDSSFRPVPLEQHFIGIRGKPGGQQSRKNLDRVTFEKVDELVREGHQVMVFVHARKETVKTALALKEAALAEGALDEFSCGDHPMYSVFRRNISESRNKEMKQLFDDGFGIHHAGMLRSDRNMMERMFEARAIKVLCCTATLAWGVNLPAHAVIIKGTQVYDSAKGSFVDLSILDVLQVFGRAGRPGLESSGVGYICTTEDKLTHYLDLVTSQIPIESQFIKGMVDALNAEIALGTVANVHDAVQWVGYTYLFVRMRKSPFQYGLSREQVADDPHLFAKRNQLVGEAASRLAEACMITFDIPSGNFAITDLGRIAAKYYIRHASIEIFNKEFRERMTEADVLRMLSMSTEFNQMQVRETELKELKSLTEVIPCKVNYETDTSEGKVNILLQSYISGFRPEDFALVSDQAYAAQNGGRIVRSLLEIAISRKWANVSAVLMGMSKAIEKRLWPFDQPLKQFEGLKQEVFYNLERWADDYSVAELASMTASELGKLVHLNERHGLAIRDAAKQFPTVQLTYNLRPLGSDVLKIAVRVARMFNWSSKVHGSVEPFWLWIEDHEGLIILQLSHLLFRQTTDALEVDFVISIPDGKPPPFVTARFVSDRWMGAEDELEISLEGLIMPTPSDSHTPRLDLPFLPLSVVQNPVLEDAVSQRLHSFNALQTQVFWSLTKTRLHALLCAPTGCGKETLRQTTSTSWALVVAPRSSISAEVIAAIQSVSKDMRISAEFCTSETVFLEPQKKSVRVITAADLLVAMSRHHERSVSLSTLRLVLCESLELLDPAYELSISLLLHATQTYPVRFLGLSNSLNDPADLAAWLNVDPLALHSFRPSDRDQSLTLDTQTFTIPQSAALFKAMTKPAHAAIQASPREPAIVFVPSRGQCRSVALDLITQCALQMETARGYLPNEVLTEHLTRYLDRLQDRGLVDFVTRGVGFYYSGITKTDRSIILELYAEGVIRVLIVPHDSCWSLPVRAATVVVMGTQYVHVAQGGEERQLRDYGLEELVRMQGRAVRHDSAGHFHLFCQAETKDTFTRFLTGGLPLESKMVETDDLRVWYRDRRKDGTITGKQQAVDVLSFTFLARRLFSNPVYYDASSTSVNELLSRVVDDLEDSVADTGQAS